MLFFLACSSSHPLSNFSSPFAGLFLLPLTSGFKFYSLLVQAPCYALTSFFHGLMVTVFRESKFYVSVPTAMALAVPHLLIGTMANQQF